MKSYAYYFELQTLLEQFVSAFNDVIIKNYDNTKAILPPQNGLKVNFYYAPKTRVFNYLRTPGPAAMKVPAIAVQMTGLQRDNSRIFNKIEGLYAQNKGGTVKSIPSPVPVNIGVDMTIITQYQSDMNQILSNFVPYNDPYVILSWYTPTTETSAPVEIRTEVLWSGGIQLQYPEDITGEKSYRIIATTSFVIKGWVFKKIEENVGKIFKIDSDYTPISITDLLEYNDNTEFFTISARPILADVYPQTVFISTGPLSGTSIDINLLGSNFQYTRNVYLSSTPSAMLSGSSFHNPFSSVAKLSSIYTGFNGIVVPEYQVTTDKYIQFTLPQIPTSAGFIDVIVENEAGYGKLTVDTIRPYLNPYPPTHPLHSTYVQEQSPAVSGIKVEVV